MSTPTKTYDLVIIGGGPAGLSTALTFGRLKRSCLVFDSGVYRNANSKTAHTIPGFEGVDPAVWRKTTRKQLEDDYEWVEFKDEKVMSVKKEEGGGEGEGKGFVVESQGGERVLAKKLTLATGIKDNLPGIPGLEELWGTRAVHCIFCHGTETRHQPIACLLYPKTPMTPMMVESFLKLWVKLEPPQVYFFTNGECMDTQEALDEMGLGKHMDIIKSRGYKIIDEKIESINSSDPTILKVIFENRTPLEIGHIVTFPASMSPHPDSLSFLNKDLLSSDVLPMGTVPLLKPEEVESSGFKMPPGMGDDPRTPVYGLFWAGNSGSMMANINVAVAQGQNAAFMAGDQLGKEEMEEEKKMAGKQAQ